MIQKVLGFTAQVKMKFCEKHNSCKQNLDKKTLLGGKVSEFGTPIFCYKSTVYFVS